MSESGGLRPLILVLASLATAACTAAQAENKLDRAGLKLVFAEEFDRPPSFWDARSSPKGRWKTNYHFGVQETAAPKGWESRTLAPNEELQYYGDPALAMDSFEWEDGELAIVAKPNPHRTSKISNGLPYLSGLITTEKSFAQATGYFEARIAIPQGKGVWPAFWLLPQPVVRNGWSTSSGTQEIDIFESIGEPGRLYFTYFPGHPEGKKVPDQIALDTGADLGQFHTYGVMLTAKEIVWYFDDREVRRITNRDFHRPAYMLLNLAIGGKWPGAPDGKTPFPARMRIDWVRAYALEP